MDAAGAAARLQGVGLSAEKAGKLAATMPQQEDGTYAEDDVTRLVDRLTKIGSRVSDLSEQYDTDNTGAISFDQAHTIARTLFPNVASEALMSMIKRFDKDKNERVDMHELTEFFVSLVIRRESLLQHFRELDTDGDDTLDEIELGEILLKQLGLIHTEHARAIIDCFDRNDDGKISRDEFITLWTQLFDY